MNNLAERHETRNRTSPWIGVGTSGEWDNYTDALADSGLDFTVAAMPAFVETYEPYKDYELVNHQMVPGISVNMKVGSSEILGVTSDRYGIVQNNTAFSLMQPFCENGALIKHAGMTAQGMCFMVAEMMNYNVAGDAFKVYICMTNSFNSKFPLSLFVTPVRVICQNMFRNLMSNNENMLNIKHGCQIDQRFKLAQDCNSMVMRYMGKFNDMVEGACLTDVDIDKMIELMFPYKKATTVELQPRMDALVEETREMFHDVYYKAPDNQDYWGTAFGFINAYYDWMSHRPQTRGDSAKWEQRRFTGLLSGNDINRKLINTALAGV